MVTKADKDALLLAFAKRLNHVLDEEGFPKKFEGRQIELAQKMSVTAKGARKWLEGETYPSTKRLDRLCRLLNVRVEYLSLGRGQMRPSRDVTESNIASSSKQCAKLVRELMVVDEEYGIPDWSVKIIKATLDAIKSGIKK